MMFRRDETPAGPKWVVILTKAEAEVMTEFLRVRFAPSVEGVSHICLVATPYSHQTQFMDVEVEA